MRVAVIGAGVMGPGIAQTFLMGGHDATIVDISEEALVKGIKEVEKCLKLMEEMEIITGADDMFTRLSCTASLEEGVADADLVIEAVPEKLELKMQIYQELDPLCKPDAVITSNTSSFPISVIFDDFRPGNFFVSHFFNPPAINPLVEIVHNDKTDLSKVQWLRQILEDCGKKPVVVSNYVMGFLINRMQIAMLREGLHLIEQGIVSIEDMDMATKVGFGFKTAWQGMFETMDFIGLDTVDFSQTLLLPDLYAGLEPSPLVKSKVEEGKLGLKTGEGFFKYGDESEATQDRRFMMLVEQLKLYKQFGI
ncbi:MAG: 3-hydroxyacyl-CoA dehydrogenase family protein [Coriobacteriia bacterium]|nr:3-hydroxyacyl-CoA dehydrogenase family protein [Coriobacteriia bacterium]MCL2751014.1 3-hydroxyacyl-CoA dehydrogenase family protein [Coriobacteriia bacterium]